MEAILLIAFAWFFCWLLVKAFTADPTPRSDKEKFNRQMKMMFGSTVDEKELVGEKDNELESTISSFSDEELEEELNKRKNKK